MARKRMFKSDVLMTDNFMGLALSTQMLYIYLCMYADDDGFVPNPRSIQEMVRCGREDLRTLLEKRYIIAFDEKGIIVIRHWRVHNSIRKDRYTPTIYQDELSQLIVGKNTPYEKCEEVRVEEVKVIEEKTPKEIKIENDIDDWWMKSQEIWEKTFAEYPKQYAEERGRQEWERLVNGLPDPEHRLNVTRGIYKAIRLYVADYKENNPEDTSFKYIPRFDNWLRDHLPVWEKKVRELEK